MRQMYFLLIMISACQSSVHDKSASIAGLWKLHIIETQDSISGQWIESDWMKGGDGYLHYDENKTMSIHFTPAGFDQQNPDGLDLDSLAIDELKVLASDYWYVGKYQILDDEVEHQRIMHSDPNEWGKTVRRTYRFSGDTLELSAKEFGLRLKWIHVQDKIEK